MKVGARIAWARERVRFALVGWLVRRRLDRLMRHIDDQAKHVEAFDCLVAILRFDPKDFYSPEQLLAAYRHAARRGLRALRSTRCGKDLPRHP